MICDGQLLLKTSPVEKPVRRYLLGSNSLRWALSGKCGKSLPLKTDSASGPRPSGLAQALGKSLTGLSLRDASEKTLGQSHLPGYHEVM